MKKNPQTFKRRVTKNPVQPTIELLELVGDSQGLLPIVGPLLLMVQKSGEKTTWDGAKTLKIMG